MRRIKVIDNMRINTVLYKSSNLLLLGLRNNESDIAFIVCEGLSMDVNDENFICQWDFGMSIPTQKEYPEFKGDILLMYFPFDCEGLENAGEELASYINWNMYMYKNIILIGHSKAGVCFANMARLLERRTTMMFISAPFLGTKIVEPAEVARYLNFIEYSIYDKVYSKHNVDIDIMRGSNFIRNADYSGVKNHKCINVISEIKSIRSIADIGCYYLKQRLKYCHSDGIIEVYSQEYLNKKYSEVAKIYIDASHANSLYRVLSENRNKYIID